MRGLNEQPGQVISLGGVRLPVALAAAGLIDEYAFVVYPVIAGRGLRLLDGVELTLELAERRESRSRATVQRYRPAAQPGPARSGRARPWHAGHSAATETLHVTPNRSVSIPNPALHAEAASGSTIVASIDRVSQ